MYVKGVIQWLNGIRSVPKKNQKHALRKKPKKRLKMRSCIRK